MTVAVLVVTDGRLDYLRRTVASLHVELVGDIGEWWLMDDSGDDLHRSGLAVEFPHWRHINGGPRRGFGGAISAAWAVLAAESTAGHVFHAEGDFTFNRLVDVDEMAAVLTARPYLAQMALRRQPWNAQERSAGGVVEQQPDAYTEAVDGSGRRWLEHSLWWTTNPSLYRRDLCAGGWPAGRESEGRYGFALRERGLPWGVPGEDVRFAFWGKRSDPPWVEHIGAVRAGSGY